MIFILLNHRFKLVTNINLFENSSFYVLLLFTVGYHGNQNNFFSMQGGCIFYIFKLKVTVKMLKIKRLM